MKKYLLYSFAIIVILLAGYFFLPSKYSYFNSSVQPNTADTTVSQAQQHIKKLVQDSENPINITNANGFVTAEQLLSLPAPAAGSNRLKIGSPEVAESNDKGTTFAITTHRPIIGENTPETAVTTSNQELNKVRLQELLDNPDLSAENIYFIHSVNNADAKGLWGIIQYGLMENFTAGLKFPGEEKSISIHIPEQADERLDDQSSSFLGHILKKKVDQSYIYNYENGILGEDPNMIKPGQQLVIVSFTRDELVDIYNHFAEL